MVFGIVGTGTIVDRFVAASADVAGVSFSAVYSRSTQRGTEFARKHNLKKHYSVYSEMLADQELDFIYIASPNSMHYEQSLAALEAGKSVVCEKPFTTHHKEAIQLAKIAKKRKLYLFEAITTVYLPNYKKIKTLLNRVGKIKIVKCNYSQYSPRYDKLLAGEVTNVFNPEFSGGALMDLNIYNLHFVAGLFGEPEKVSYFPNKHANGIDTSGIAILQYDGFVCECTASKDTNGKNFALIQGETGYIYIEDSVNYCRSFVLNSGGINYGENLQDKENILYYEINEFAQIVREGALSRSRKLLDYSCSVMKILEETRMSGGIVFNNIVMSKETGL